MTRRTHLLGLLASAALTLGACDHVDPVHPLDPESPADQQATATLRGRLLAPADASADLFAASEVHLRPARDVEAAIAVATPDAGGAFAFPRLRPDSYVLTVAAPGFLGDPLPVRLGPGETVDLGALALRRAEAARPARVAGTVLREDRVAGGHAGVVVSASGGGATVSGADGGFTLEVAAGPRTLRFDAAGHLSETRDVVARADEVVTLEAPVVLVALPGRVSGRVALRRFETPDRLAEVGVTAARADDPAGEPRAVTVEADGTFVFEDLRPGPWRLRAAARGYDATTRAVRVRADDATDLGVLELPHASTGPGAVELTGAVRLADNASPAGARVLVRISGTQLTFAQLVADADGAFSVAAAADEAYDVLATLEGYAPLALGPLVYDAEQDRFEDEQGERPILVLTPAP